MEEWGTCSSPCGEGIRERKVQCKIFLEFSKTVAVLPDHECPGPKPATTEICFSGLCDIGEKVRKHYVIMKTKVFLVLCTYIWTLFSKAAQRYTFEEFLQNFAYVLHANVHCTMYKVKVEKLGQ